MTRVTVLPKHQKRIESSGFNDWILMPNTVNSKDKKLDVTLKWLGVSMKTETDQKAEFDDSKAINIRQPQTSTFWISRGELTGSDECKLSISQIKTNLETFAAYTYSLAKVKFNASITINVIFKLYFENVFKGKDLKAVSEVFLYEFKGNNYNNPSLTKLAGVDQQGPKSNTMAFNLGDIYLKNPNYYSAIMPVRDNEYVVADLSLGETSGVAGTPNAQSADLHVSFSREFSF